MRMVFVAILAFSTVSAHAASLIECDGIDNPNTGIVRILTDEDGKNSKKVLVATFQDGTIFHSLSNVRIIQNNNLLVNHVDARGTRLMIELSNQQLTDGSNTIRPFYYKSRVYFEVGNYHSSINSRYMKCRIFDHF